MSTMPEKNQSLYPNIEELVTTVSGTAILKSLDEKRNRYKSEIELAIQKKYSKLQEKKISIEAVRQSMLELVAALLEKSRIIDDFFKFKIKLQDNALQQSIEQEKKDKGQLIMEAQLQTIEAMFR